MKIVKTTIIVIILILILLLLFAFSSPTRAIRTNALAMGCDFGEVIAAEFVKVNDDDPNSWGDKYITQSELEDRVTGTCHSAWYVHRILFINIPQWAGNG